MKRWLTLLSSLLIAVCAYAQQPQTPEEMEKQLMEYIDKEVQRLSGMLKLEYWQEFYVDSTLVHDLHAMQDEMKGLQEKKVANVDMYTAVGDKWQEQIYEAYHKFFNEEQGQNGEKIVIFARLKLNLYERDDREDSRRAE